MKEKIPLKFTKTLPTDPVKLWNIIDSTIEEVDPQFGISIEEAKIKVFITLANNQKNYSQLKLMVKPKIDNIEIIAPTTYFMANYDITEVSPKLLDIGLPAELINKIGNLAEDSITSYAIPEKYLGLYKKTFTVIQVSDATLSNISITIDNTLPPLYLTTKRELEILILSNEVYDNKPLPPLYRY